MPYRDRPSHRKPQRRRTGAGAAFASREQRRGGLPSRRTLTVALILAVAIVCVIAGLAVTACRAQADLDGNGLPATGDRRTGNTGTDTRNTDTAGGQGASTQDHPGAVMLDVPYLSQFPDLPTGCEVTAATMMLDYYGYSASATDVDDFLPKSDYVFTADDDGTIYGPDPDLVFIGDTRTPDGSFCNPGPIVVALNDYIASVGGHHRAQDITGTSPEALYQLVSEGTPVVVWVTTYLQDLTVDDTWNTESGNLVETSTTDHAMVLIGFDPTEDTVTFNDPIDDASVTYDRATFEEVYRSRGQMAVRITG